MLKRKIDDALKEWKKKKDKLPLIVQGGRQVGKTTSIINFGKNNYSKFYKINFIETPSAMEAFRGDLSPIAIMARLSLVIPDFIIEDGDTLIFLLMQKLFQMVKNRCVLTIPAQGQRISD